MKLCGIYRITNTVNGKSYVGISLDVYRRWRAHRRPKPSSKSVIHEAIRKYGIDAFTFSVLEECEQDQLSVRERFWIEKLGTFVDGYNLTSGGESGRELAESTKQKLRALYLGVKRGPYTQEHRDAIRAAKKGICTLSREQIEAIAAKRRGVKQSVEWAANAALARTGLKRSAETRMRMSNAQKGNKRWLGKRHSLEARARMSVAQKGRTFSPETRLKMSMAARGRIPWNKKIEVTS